jgi:UDP-3-O-[3-hydroxymyristoyl] N-acetylglucosamine deacetylase
MFQHWHNYCCFCAEEDMSNQTSARTLMSSFTIHGYGLHGNKPCSVTVKPAENGGLLFLHKTLGVTIPARADYVGDLSLATTLAKDGARLGTVEHILSALYGLGVDHALIEADGEELPILDGSAAPWVEAISQVGLKDLAVNKIFIRVTRAVQVRNGNCRIGVSPYAGLRLDYTIDFPCSSIGTQSLKLDVTPDQYRRELGNARTFCLQSEIDAMRSRGLALGGSLENAVVFGDDGCMNESLRFEDEAVRHKMLDLMGDLALLGAPLLGAVEASAAGHAMHIALVKRLLSEPDAWTKSETAEYSQKLLNRTRYSTWILSMANDHHPA